MAENLVLGLAVDVMFVLSLDAGSKLRVSKSKPDFRRWMEGLVGGWIGG